MKIQEAMADRIVRCGRGFAHARGGGAIGRAGPAQSRRVEVSIAVLRGENQQCRNLRNAGRADASNIMCADKLEKKRLEELVGRAKRSETDALAELCELFYPQVYRFMLARVATREDAEDLAGEVCARAVESLPKQEGFFPAWLFRIARNLVADFHRRRQVRNRVESSYDENTAGSVPDPADAGEAVMMGRDLTRALSHLTSEQQEVIRLRFVEGYDTTEIAEILEKSPGAVRALQFRALETLRDLMDSAAGGMK